MSEQSQNKSSSNILLDNVRYDEFFQSDETEFRELISVLYEKKIIILVFTIVFSIISVVYAITQSNIYTSDVVVAPANKNGQTGLSGMAAQFGGLASLAGIDLGKDVIDDTEVALATLTSRQFVTYFITKYDLLIPIFASKTWDPEANRLVIDEDIYDESAKKWIRDFSFPQKQIPSTLEAYDEFTDSVIAVNKDKDNGLITISIRHHSPYVAQKWAELIVEEINLWMKERSLETTQKNIEYLKLQLEKTDVTEMKTVFYQLIEEQTKQLMLAEVEEEYSFRIIDPAVAPEKKSGPNRALICVLGSIAGAMFGVLFVLLSYFSRKKEA